MVVVILLAGVPVYRLTRPAPAEAAASASIGDAANRSPDGKSAPLEVDAVFAPSPADFQLKNLDQTVLAGRGPQARFHTRWAATVPPEGVDLVIQAHWPSLATADAPAAPAGAAPAAARITVRFADGRQVEKSFWSAANGTLMDVFTVPGEGSVAAP